MIDMKTVLKKLISAVYASPDIKERDKIVFDVAERNVKCYTTKKSQLTFNVLQGEDCFGNVFAEDIPIKSSLIRENWLKEIKTY